MKKYPKYKQSGVDRLGEIPCSWNCKNLKRITKFAYGDSLPDENRNGGAVPVYGSNGIVGFHDEAITKAPCIIVGRKGSYGRLNYSEKACFPIDTSYFIDSTQTKCDLKWLIYFLSILRLDENTLDDTVPGLSREWAYRMPGLILPLPEQQSIVHFLDYKTEQIDGFIANRQKQIELLKEQLHFKINDAITKGITTKVKFKPTDIKYVSEIPEHWDIRKFKSLTTILTCGVAATPEYVEESEGVAFLSAQNCRPFAMDLTKYSYIKPSLHKQLTRYKKPQRGDVLVTRVGAGIGQACIIDTDLEFSIYVSLTHIRPNKEILSEYIVYFFNTEYCYQLNHEGTIVGGGQGNLNVKNVERYRIPLPPIEEQKEIIQYLDKFRMETDSLISKYQRQIDLMKEYRTSLISQAVTGKIDVRKWQPKREDKAS